MGSVNYSRSCWVEGTVAAAWRYEARYRFKFHMLDLDPAMLTYQYEQVDLRTSAISYLGNFGC